MHHKYVIRDGAAVWTGSTNWTDDSWTREENVILTVDSAPVAAPSARTSSSSGDSGEVEGTGRVTRSRWTSMGSQVRPWFCPERGPTLAHRIAKRIGEARRRVRIASPVLTSGPILGTLAEVVPTAGSTCRRASTAPRSARSTGSGAATAAQPGSSSCSGRCCAWRRSPASPRRPTGPALSTTTCTPSSTVADDIVFAGSFNLSHSGEMNAENVLEIEDAKLAEEMAAYVDIVRARYPRAPEP